MKIDWYVLCNTGKYRQIHAAIHTNTKIQTQYNNTNQIQTQYIPKHALGMYSALNTSVCIENKPIYTGKTTDVHNSCFPFPVFLSLHDSEFFLTCILGCSFWKNLNFFLFATCKALLSTFDEKNGFPFHIMQNKKKIKTSLRDFVRVLKGKT